MYSLSFDAVFSAHIASLRRSSDPFVYVSCSPVVMQISAVTHDQGFLRCFRDPIRVPRIRQSLVPRGSYRVPNIFLKKTGHDCVS